MITDVGMRAMELQHRALAVYNNAQLSYWMCSIGKHHADYHFKQLDESITDLEAFIAAYKACRAADIVKEKSMEAAE